MTFFIFMLIMALLIPITMISFGYYFKSKPVSVLTFGTGYRTKRSLQSKETWEYAQRIFGKLWFLCGVILLIISLVLFIFLYHKDIDQISWISIALIYVQIVGMLLPIPIIERKLKQNFDQEGHKKIGGNDGTL